MHVLGLAGQQWLCVTAHVIVVYYYYTCSRGCRSAVAGGTADVIGFSDPANGVTVSRLHLSSTDDASLIAFRLKVDPNGCADIKGTWRL